MAFVYEYISDEDKQRIDFSKIRVGGNSADSYQWVIDRDLDAFLVWVSPNREPPRWKWYAFWWRGEVIPVGILEKDRLKTPNDKWIIPVTFRVHTLGSPYPKLTPKLKAMLVKIEEAIEAEMRGNALEAGWGQDVVEVQVEYINEGEA